MRCGEDAEIGHRLSIRVGDLLHQVWVSGAFEAEGTPDADDGIVPQGGEGDEGVRYCLGREFTFAEQAAFWRVLAPVGDPREPFRRARVAGHKSDAHSPDIIGREDAGLPYALAFRLDLFDAFFKVASAFCLTH
jgi:hypothetical protein